MAPIDRDDHDERIAPIDLLLQELRVNTEALHSVIPLFTNRECVQ